MHLAPLPINSIMPYDTTAWKTQDPAWVKLREKEWLEDGMPLVTRMYQRGGDLNPEKAQAIKDYFLTGNYDTEPGFPFFYRLRFYPGDSKQWLTNCVFDAPDRDVGRYIKMYEVDSLGKNNAVMADILFSNRFEARLREIELANDRPRIGNYAGSLDLTMIEKRCRSNARALRGLPEDGDTDHYFYCLGDRWLDIALDFDRRNGFAEQRFVKKINHLMDRSLTALVNSENDQEVIELAKHLIALIDEKLQEGHELFDVWQGKKLEAGLSN